MRPGQKVNGISSERVGGVEEKRVRERDTLFPRPARIYRGWRAKERGIADD